MSGDRLRELFDQHASTLMYGSGNEVEAIDWQDFEAAARALLAEAQPAQPQPVGAIGEEAGLHGKYIIHKASGEPVAYPCFVLRIDGSDAAAISALRSYAMAARNAHLRQDILLMLAETQPEPAGSTDPAWREFIEAVQHAQHVAVREGESPRFDLVATAFALWRSAAPEPVSVAERPWEREGWCDEDGRCWLFGKVEGDWRLMSAANSGLPSLKYCFSHALPHWALPLPQEQADG